MDQPGSCPLQNVPTKQYPVQVFSHLDLTLLSPPPPYEKQGGEDVYATIGRICVIISTYLCTFAHVNSFLYRWKKYGFQKGGGGKNIILDLQ